MPLCPPPNHKHVDKYMTVRNVSSIMSHEILSNNFINLQDRDVDITINFLLGVTMGDQESFDTNHLPDPESLPRDIYMG